MTHLDTSFIVDLLREQARGTIGPARARLESLAGEPVAVSVFVACELEAGAARAHRPAQERERVRALWQAVGAAWPDARFAPKYGELLASVTARGLTMATMDLLIATQAVVEGAALVTRNRRHFEVISELTLVAY